MSDNRIGTKQYAFTPQPRDPRLSAEDHWDDLKMELNVTRDSLETMQALCTSQAAMIDMLRTELASAKAAHARDEIALTTMRAKFETAAGIILEVMRPIERAPEPVPEPPKTVPDEYGVRNVKAARFSHLPPIEDDLEIAELAVRFAPEPEPEEDVVEMALRLAPVLQNSWPQ